ncbi:hypothetical protein [Hymenobacter convexus]|uniref:hypothetical protein n=1 Tax=Hymenobacter sp. CA1UV-4 TaxID=3063782 RepID=UPI00271224AE|nr:hypothetical protein [Hymenobacter sp. CA1UV-4]MDO7852310.1 hypothetical protein [Hymenobacter sp. CA1UV-4]
MIIPFVISIINEIKARPYREIVNKNRHEQDERDQKYKQALQANVAPVLYLRPFAIDGAKVITHEKRLNMLETSVKGTTFGKNLEPIKTSSIEFNFEQSLCEMAEVIGPFVAIGKPTWEDLNFGAYRLYCTNEVWQKTAFELMQSAAMILVRVKGELSNGFNWELTRISELFLYKTVFIFEVSTQCECDSIRSVFKALELNFEI